MIRWINGMAIPTLAMTLGLLLPGQSQSQIIAEEEPPDMTVTPAMRTEVIEGVLRELKKSYVFPDVAKKMEEAVHARVKGKEYEQITSAAVFARTLTEHLRAVSHDKHLGVRYFAKPLPSERQQQPSSAELEKRRRFAAARNFGSRWGAIGPNSKASRTPVQESGFLGGMKRLGPLVEAPYASPLKIWIPSTTVPRTFPFAVSTTALTLSGLAVPAWIERRPQADPTSEAAAPMAI